MSLCNQCKLRCGHSCLEKNKIEKLFVNKEQPGRYRWAKVRVGVGSGLIIRAWATGSKIHIISFPIVFKLFFITDQRGGGISWEVRCCRRVVRTWPETRGQNISKVDFDSISPHTESSTLTACPLTWSCNPLSAKALNKSHVHLTWCLERQEHENLWISYLWDRLGSTHPFHYKEHPSPILSHHLHVVVKDLCRQLRNAGGRERNMYKSEAVTLFHEFPSNPHKPSPTPREFQPLSFVWWETSAHHIQVTTATDVT